MQKVEGKPKKAIPHYMLSKKKIEAEEQLQKNQEELELVQKHIRASRD